MSLQHRDEQALVYPTQASVAATLSSIEAFQALVQDRLKEPKDFAKLPGTQRYTLLKPGAEKIVKLVRCADLYDILDAVTDWDRGLFAFTIKCRLVSMTDQTVIWSEGVGECNTREPKYRYRKAQRVCPECGVEAILKSKREPGWFCWVKRDGCGTTFGPNDPAIVDQDLTRTEHKDPAELRNTMLKMAKKRALVDAALSVASLSDLFTQDMEDQVADTQPDDGDEPTPSATRNGASRPASRAATQQVPTDARQIENAGKFMEYVNGRWPGHPQQDVLNSLGTKKMSDLTWSGAKVADYVKALEGFWGPGGVEQDDEDAQLADRDPDADPTRDSEEAADVSPTASDGMEAAV